MPRGYLSPKREIEYQNLVLLRRSRDISAEVYKNRVNRLYAQQGKQKEKSEKRKAVVAQKQHPLELVTYEYHTAVGGQVAKGSPSRFGQLTAQRRKGERLTSFMRRIQNEIDHSIDDAYEEDYPGMPEKGRIDGYVRVGAPVFNARPAQPTGMTRARPFQYEGAGFISLVDDGACVPKSLFLLYESAFKKKRRTLTYQSIVDFFGGDESKPVTADQVQEWCLKYDITCLGVDSMWKELVYSVSKNRQFPPLYFVRKDEHFYVMDKEKADKFVKKRGNSHVTVKDKDEEAAPLVRVRVESVADIDAASSSHYIVSKLSTVVDAASAYMSRTGLVPKRFNYGVTANKSIYLRGCSLGNSRVSCVPNYDVVEELGADFKDESMLSVASLSKKLFSEELPTSSFNTTLYTILKNWKKRQHHASLVSPDDWEHVEGVEQTWDMNKAYTNALLSNTHPWLLFDEFCLPAAFDGVVKDALYFVKTANVMPCFGNELMTRVKLEALMNSGDDYEIVYQILPSSTLPADYFVEFVQECMKKSPKNYKHVINNFIGSFNTHEKKTTHTVSGMSRDEILSQVFATSGQYSRVAVGDDYLHICADITTQPLLKNNMPFYTQVLDFAAVQLSNQVDMLRGLGAYIRSYNTDSITFKTREKLDTSRLSSAIGGWKEETPKPLAKCMKEPFRRRDVIQFELPTFKEDLAEDELGTEGIVEYMSGHSCVLQGEAGYGKSYILNALREKLGDSLLVSAYTHIAANNVGGNTIHHTLHLDFNGHANKSLAKCLEGKKYWAIDEISLVPARDYVHFIEARRLGITVWLLGDFGQLKPVGAVRAASDSSILELICENRITLTQYKRGDEALLSELKKTRETGDVTGFDVGMKGDLHFCFTKRQRDAYNAYEIQKHPGRLLETLHTPISLSKVYRGLPVRSVVTNEIHMNNERFIVASSKKNAILLESQMRKGWRITVTDEEFMKDFVAGYAMTIHSSQGLTVTEPYTIHIDYNTRFTKDDVQRLIYTAVSRAQRLSQIGIMCENV